MAECFSGMLYGISENLRQALNSVPYSVKERTEEIRLRQSLPLALTVSGNTLFVGKNGQTSSYLQNDSVIVSKYDLEQSFRLLCNNSAFAHSEELKNGYIRLKNGSRAGVFGTVNLNGDMEDITCINIRIAREIKGCAEKIAADFNGEGWLIAGPPGSGKTTVLKDFVRQISCGTNKKNYRVAVIDSRGELSGIGFNDLGVNTDVLNIQDKAKGIEMALRTMFPQVIAFDEIGNLKELEKIKESFNSGVAIITTAHIGDTSELMKRNITRELILSNAVKKVAVLSGTDIKILTLEELLNDSI